MHRNLILKKCLIALKIIQSFYQALNITPVSQMAFIMIIWNNLGYSEEVQAHNCIWKTKYHTNSKVIFDVDCGIPLITSLSGTIWSFKRCYWRCKIFLTLNESKRIFDLIEYYLWVSNWCHFKKLLLKKIPWTTVTPLEPFLYFVMQYSQIRFFII